MFGLGVTELIVIFVIALVVFGPKKLPELGKSLGKAIAQFKRASDEVKESIESEVRAAESSVDFKKLKEDVEGAGQELKKQVEQAGEGTHEAVRTETTKENSRDGHGKS